MTAITPSELAAMRERANAATAKKPVKVCVEGIYETYFAMAPLEAVADFNNHARTDIILLLDALDEMEKQVREWVAVSVRRRAEAKEAEDATMDKWYGGMADAFGIVLRLLESTSQEEEVPHA